MKVHPQPGPLVGKQAVVAAKTAALKLMDGGNDD